MPKVVPALPVPPAVPEEHLDFEIEVSDFVYVRQRNGKRALRFTVTWKIDHPKYGLLGVSQEGWLMTRQKEKLRVAPPLTRYGYMAKQLNLITVGLHDLILGLIVNHKTKKGTSYGDLVGDVKVSHFFPEGTPSDFDPDLPKEIPSV